jgi:DNA-binding FadR family transcriptional regulator
VEIARASGNAAYAVLVITLWGYRSKPLFSKLEELLIGPDRPATTATEQERIYEAIADRDRTAARLAMKRHVNLWGGMPSIRGQLASASPIA